MKVLANDGVSSTGVKILEAAGFEVSTENVNQDNLIDHLNKNNTEVLLVRSATVVRKTLLILAQVLRLLEEEVSAWTISMLNMPNQRE